MAEVSYLRPGEKLCEYRIEQLLARGGFGEVYEAFDEHFRRRVALKFVFARLDADKLRREVNILFDNAEKLGFIPNIYKHWKDKKHRGYIIVMRFIEGETLDEIRPLPWKSDMVVEFLRIMLRNLHDLHSLDIVHCDIKPINIKETPPSKLFSHVPYMLLDFGIAKQGNQTTIPATSDYYAAPEQYHEHREMAPALRVDQRTDLYGLAATVYYLLTGKTPIHAKKRFSNAMLIQDDTAVHADDVSAIASIPKGLRDVLFEMLRVFPEQRPPNALAALELLERKLREDHTSVAAGSDLPSPPLPIEPVVSSDTEVRVAPEPQPTLAGDELPDNGGHPGPSPSEQSQKIGDDARAGEANAQTDIREAEPSGDIAADGYPLHATYTTKIVAGDTSAAGGSQPPQDLGGREIQPSLTSHGHDVHSLALLAGGHTLATLGQSLQLWSVGEDALTAAPLTDSCHAHPRAIAASPDGRLLAVVVGDSLQLRQAADGQVLQARPARLAQARGLTFSADGGRLLLIEADAIAVYDAASAVPAGRLALGDARAIDHVALGGDGSLVALHGAGKIAVRSLAASAELCALALPTGQDVTALALTPEGSSLAVATFDALTIWRVGHGGPELIGRRPISGQASAHSLLFRTDGRILASLHSGDAHFWHVGDTWVEHLAVGRGHTAKIDDIVIAAQGTSAITAARDGTLRLWHLPEA